MHRHVAFAVLSVAAAIAAQEPEFAEQVQALRAEVATLGMRIATLELRIAALEQQLAARPAPAAAPAPAIAEPDPRVQPRLDDATALLDAGDFAGAVKAFDALAEAVAKEAWKLDDATMAMLLGRRAEATFEHALFEAEIKTDDSGAARDLARAVSLMERVLVLPSVATKREGTTMHPATWERLAIANASLWVFEKRPAKREENARRALVTLRKRFPDAVDARSGGEAYAKRAEERVRDLLRR